MIACMLPRNSFEVFFIMEKKESYIATLVGMYQSQKVQSSEGIIPDDNSALLKRSWMQYYIWCQCTEKQINFPAINETLG